MNRLVRRFALPLGSTALWIFFVVAHARIIADVPYDPFSSSRFAWSAVFLVGYLTSAYAVGLPELPRSRTTAVVSAGLAVAAALTIVSVIQLVLGTPLLPRATIGGLVLTLPVWTLIAWHGTKDSSHRGAARILVVASSEDRAALEADLMGQLDRPAEIVGHLETVDAERRADGSEPLVELADRVRPTILVLDSTSHSEPSVVAQAARLHAAGVRIRTISLFSEEYLGKIPVPELERVSLLFDIGELHRAHYVRAKRLLDIVLGSVGVVVLATVTPFVILGNLVANRGPLLYSQPRIGKSGDEFVIYKFRSMRAGGTSEWTEHDDDRITRFGGLLRRSHLDELPQTWNILVGNLSIVGPRPEQPHYVRELEEKIPYFGVRHLVRPGLTGWAQVNYRYASSESDAREKLQYDLYYLRRQSAILDLRIVARTLRTVFLGGGR